MNFTEGNNAIVTIGIKPSRPETGYGYVESAEKYLDAGNYLWNAGIFVWNIDTITESIKTYKPALASQMEEMVPANGQQPMAKVETLFPTCEKISIDFAVIL